MRPRFVESAAKRFLPRISNRSFDVNWPTRTEKNRIFGFRCFDSEKSDNHRSVPRTIRTTALTVLGKKSCHTFRIRRKRKTWKGFCSWSGRMQARPRYQIVFIFFCLLASLKRNNLLLVWLDKSKWRRQERLEAWNLNALWAVVVARLVERSLPTPEICGSNLDIGQNFVYHLYSRKDKNKEKEARNGPS